MSKKEFIALISNASTVIISVLGKTLDIKSCDNGSFTIEDKSQNSNLMFSSAFELIEKYMIMNLSLETLVPWINVTSVI